MKLPLAFLLCLFVLPSAWADQRAWNFRVLLDGREIGHHRYMVQPKGDALAVRSEAAFDVKLLFVNAYQYRHEAVEHWRGNCLDSLNARTKTNGEQETVAARREGDRLKVDRTGVREEHEGCVMSFAYWNPQFLASPRLLNSQTGEVVPVKVSALGPEPVEVRGRTVAADRHRVSGPGMQIDVWYANGTWVGLEAVLKGGRRLRYQLD